VALPIQERSKDLWVEQGLTLEQLAGETGLLKSALGSYESKITRISAITLSQNKVTLMTLDDRYLPTAIVLPFEDHARQSKLMHAQIQHERCSYVSLSKNNLVS